MIGSVEKGLAILEFVIFKKSGSSIQEIAKNFKMSPSSAFKHLETLRKCGFLKKDEMTHLYCPTYKLVELSSIILKNVEVRDLAHPTLVELMEKTHMTVHLVLKEKDSAVYVDKIESAYTIPTMSRIGMHVNMHSTAVGKSILSFMSDEELREYLSHADLKKITKNTITTKKELLENIRLVRMRGYALDKEENEEGIFCVGAPIFNFSGRVIGAISTTANASKMDKEKIKETAFEVVKAARKISKDLGWNG